MNAADLKNRIFHEIDSLDSSKLEEFYGVMLNYINGKRDNDEWIGLAENEISGVEEAIKQLDSGQWVAHEQVMSKYKKKYPRG